jgi:hypothetical protein
LTRAVLAVALLIVLVVALPAATGPFSVECGELEPTTCEQVWRQVASDHDDGVLAFLPVTRVEIAEMTDELLCGTVSIERWIFGTVLNDYCV